VLDGAIFNGMLYRNLLFFGKSETLMCPDPRVIFPVRMSTHGENEGRMTSVRALPLGMADARKTLRNIVKEMERVGRGREVGDEARCDDLGPFGHFCLLSEIRTNGNGWSPYFRRDANVNEHMQLQRSTSLF